MDSEVSQKELAAAISRTTRTVYNLTEQGVFTKTPTGKYLLTESLNAFINYRVGLEVEQHLETDQAEAERRKAVADAETKELKLAQLRGELVTRVAHRAELTRLLGVVRQVMDTFPAKHAHRIPGDAPLPDRVGALRRVAREVLEELRRAGHGTEDVTAEPDTSSA